MSAADLAKLRNDVALFREQICGCRRHLKTLEDEGDLKNMDANLERILAMSQRFGNIRSQAQQFQKRLAMYDIIETFPEIDAFLTELLPYDKLWWCAYRWKNSYNRWTRTSLLRDLEAAAIEKDVESMLEVVSPLEVKFTRREIAAPRQVATHIKQQLQEFSSTAIPLVRTLCSPNLQSSHWKEIYEVLGFEIDLHSCKLQRVLTLCENLDLERLRQIEISAISVGVTYQRQWVESLCCEAESMEDQMKDLDEQDCWAVDRVRERAQRLQYRLEGAASFECTDGLITALRRASMTKLERLMRGLDARLLTVHVTTISGSTIAQLCLDAATTIDTVKSTLTKSICVAQKKMSLVAGQKVLSDSCRLNEVDEDSTDPILVLHLIVRDSMVEAKHA